MQKASHWPAAILFDLDGTLVDSAPDLATASNLLLGEYGHSPLSLAEIRGMIGNGVAKLVERAFAARGEQLIPATLKGRTDQMMKIYYQHLTDQSQLMAGAFDALLYCKNKGILAGIVTNKPEAATRQILANFDITGLVNVVVGGDSCSTRKPNPEMLLFAVESLGVDIDKTLMVGDSPADIDAAYAANMQSIAVRGGYTNVPAESLGANIVIENLDALTSAVQRLSEQRP